MWQTILAPIAQLLGGYLKNKAEEKQAVHERKLEVIKHESNWDNIQATNSGNSLKDEWFTLLFSIPLVMAFIPEAVPIVKNGFDVLQQMPDWYKGFLGAAVAASFGIRTLSKWGSKQ
jgi:hypothetical protein